MATTDYEVRNEFGQAEPPAERRNWWATCLIGCLAMVGVALVVGTLAAVWVMRNWRDWTSNAASQVVKQGIEASDLPAEEKQQINAEVDRVVVAFREGRLSNEQAAELMEKFVDSPLMTTVMAAAAEKNYIDKSGLNEEERAEARVTLHRFLRGSIDGDIPQASREAALSHVAEKKPDGNTNFREKVSDDELRAFLAEAKKAADEANVPEQPAKFDPSDEVKRIIDETLRGPVAAPQMPAAAPEQPAQ
jgi:hypothetical protein